MRRRFGVGLAEMVGGLAGRLTVFDIPRGHGVPPKARKQCSSFRVGTGCPPYGVNNLRRAAWAPT